jgi:endonuclease/exonuclease/phosphatase family metal-dependent hydrolase
MPAISVATYNLWGWGEPWRYTAERGIARGAVPGSPAATLRPPEGVWPRRRRLLVRALRAARPDLIGLQEVQGAPDAGSASQAAQLAADLDCHHAFAPSPHGGDKGLAVLARRPIAAARAVALPAAGPTADYLQAALHARVEVAGVPLDLIVCHLTPRDEAARLAAVDDLLDYLDGLPAGRPVIVLGDFNAAPGSPTIGRLTAPATAATRRARLRDAWREANPGAAGLTMPSQAPSARIDYILVGDGLAVLGASRLGDDPDPDGFYPSDHLGLAATLDFAAGAANHAP